MVDALLLVFLAILDLVVLAHLRHRRHEAAKDVRITRSMAWAVRREIAETEVHEVELLANAS
jgi:hypothetical protein